MNTFEQISKQIDHEIKQLNWDVAPCGLYQPIAYILSLGGKRIRPVLTLMACELFDGKAADAIAPALGIEIFHNFTLLHDDIMDKAPIRRGQPTVHIKWNENTAILSGDVMQIEAYKWIAKTPEKSLKQVLDLFSKTAAEICEGQQYDMEFETRNNVDVAEYLEMIRLKTAVLLGCALQTGAIVAGANATNANLIYEFGINLGLAFQLRDDLLDVYGNEATFGKKVGGDILCNKKTFLLINALTQAQGSDLEELEYWLQYNNENEKLKIESVTALYNRLKVKSICEDKISFFYEKAIAYLDKMDVLEVKKQELRKLADKLMSRND